MKLHNLLILFLCLLFSTGCAGGTSRQIPANQGPDGTGANSGKPDGNGEEEEEANGEPSGAETPDNDDPVLDYGYLGAVESRVPFVERIEIPEEVVAGTPFLVTVRLSAVLAPEVLREFAGGYAGIPGINNEPLTGATLHFGPTGFDGYILEMHFRDLYIGRAEDLPTWGALTDHFDFLFPGLKAGEATLAYYTAKTRELGGTPAMYSLDTGPVRNDNVELKTIKFTVEPAPAP